MHTTFVSQLDGSDIVIDNGSCSESTSMSSDDCTESDECSAATDSDANKVSLIEDYHMIYIFVGVERKVFDANC